MMGKALLPLMNGVVLWFNINVNASFYNEKRAGTAQQQTGSIKMNHFLIGRITAKEQS